VELLVSAHPLLYTCPWELVSELHVYDEFCIFRLASLNYCPDAGAYDPVSSRFKFDFLVADVPDGVQQPQAGHRNLLLSACN